MNNSDKSKKSSKNSVFMVKNFNCNSYCGFSNKNVSNLSGGKNKNCALEKMQKNNFSLEHKEYLKKIRLKTFFVVFMQIAILVTIFLLWELLVNYNILDGFIYSCPSRMVKTLGELLGSGELIKHSAITLKETLLAFIIATSIGFVIAVMLWANNTLKRILEPYIVTLNSLPKIALGPLIIIWFGAGTKAIVVMGILIVIIVTIINILNAFLNTDKNTILALESMGANKWQIFLKVVLPSSFGDIISTLKINVGLSWIGAIMGEYLVSRAGLGYLLVYGGLVFDLDLIMAVTIVLCFLASLMYFLIALVEKFVKNKK